MNQDDNQKKCEQLKFCPRCNGTGWLYAGESKYKTEDCQDCKGTGIEKSICPTCCGSRVVYPAGTYKKGYHIGRDGLPRKIKGEACPDCQDPKQPSDGNQMKCKTCGKDLSGNAAYRNMQGECFECEYKRHGTGNIPDYVEPDAIRQAYNQHIEFYCNKCILDGRNGITCNRAKHQVDHCFDENSYEEFCMIYNSRDTQVSALEGKLNIAVFTLKNARRCSCEVELRAYINQALQAIK